MDNYFGKIFRTLYNGSMVGKGTDVFALMGYVIANMEPGDVADPESDFYLELNPVLLAAIFGATPERMEEAIKFLCSPDPRSRTPDYDGRRLVREGQFLYRVVNGRKYREKLHKQTRRSSKALYQQRFRRKQLLLEVGMPAPGEYEYMEAWEAGAPDHVLQEIMDRHIPPAKQEENREIYRRSKERKVGKNGRLVKTKEERKADREQDAAVAGGAEFYGPTSPAGVGEQSDQDSSPLFGGDDGLFVEEGNGGGSE